MNNEKIKNSNSFYIKGIFVLIFLTFASSIPVAIKKLNVKGSSGDNRGAQAPTCCNGFLMLSLNNVMRFLCSV